MSNQCAELPPKSLWHLADMQRSQVLFSNVTFLKEGFQELVFIDVTAA